MNKLEMKENL